MVDKKVITLSGQQTQIVLELGEYAEILHWGKKIDGELAGQTLSLSRPVSKNLWLIACGFPVLSCVLIQQDQVAVEPVSAQ
ncbi:hypothetical protein BOO22_18485 [Vibrio cidicii]|uniref:hypothetical protein n=1 Tax=Vibrio cidicii TaxID=1763883 RepID=UPI0018C29BC6|nr:hypothetical protein [Vibrio cidicii]MBG0761393.1 hypothetical protein [Vibrio cidicii]